MQSMKEGAANAAASAKAGMEKTKASIQEKVLYTNVSSFCLKFFYDHFYLL